METWEKGAAVIEIVVLSALLAVVAILAVRYTLDWKVCAAISSKVERTSSAPVLPNTVFHSEVDFTGDHCITFDDLAILTEGFGSKYGMKELRSLSEQYGRCGC